MGSMASMGRADALIRLRTSLSVFEGQTRRRLNGPDDSQSKRHYAFCGGSINEPVALYIGASHRTGPRCRTCEEHGGH